MTAVFPSLPGLDIGVKRTVLTSTGVQSGTSGTEQRASWWSSPKYEYEVTFNALRQLTGNFTVSQDEAQALSNFFTSLGGQFTTFYFTDPLNSVATALSFGAGNGSTVTFTLTDTPASRTNYVLYSQNFAIGWGSNNATVLPGVQDPSGGMTASTLTCTGLPGGSYIDQHVLVPFGIYCDSIWIRRRTGSGPVQIQSPNIRTITVPVTSIWQQLSCSDLATSDAYIAVVLNAIGDQVDIAFAQVEPGVTPTAYIPTTTAPVTVTTSGVAVIPNGAPALYRNDWQGIQLLYPTARTNSCLGSGTIGGAKWAPINIILGAPILAPDGVGSMSYLTPTIATTAYVASYLMPFPANTNLPISLYLKAGTAYQTQVSVFDGSVSVLIGYQAIVWSGGVPSLGTNTNFTSVSLTPQGNGVWLLSGFCNIGVETSACLLIYPDLNNGVGTCYAWGAMVGCTGAYIPTATTAPVTVTDYALTGNTVTLAVAPLTDAALTWSGSFYYKVRFVQDNLDYEQIVIGAWKGNSLKLRTVK